MLDRRVTINTQIQQYGNIDMVYYLLTLCKDEEMDSNDKNINEMPDVYSI